MKKIVKILTIALMFVMSFGMVFFNPATIAFADSVPLVGIALYISNIPSKAELGQTVLVPTGYTNEVGVGVVLTITDPRGNIVLNQTNTGSETTVNFIPTLIGIYEIQYKASNQTDNLFATKSNVYYLTVTGTKPAFSFENNSQFIIPSTIGENDTVVLPLPKITLSDGETEIQSTTNLSNFTISGSTPDHSSIVFGEAEVNNVTHATFTPTADTFGTYTITYSYQDSTTGLFAKKTFSVEVEKDFDSSKIELNYTWDGSMPTSAVLGEEITLPTPVTVDENNDNASIDSYTIVSVYYVPAGMTSSQEEWISVSVDQQDFTFTPMYEAKNGSYYYITYEISSFFDISNDVTTITKNYTLTNVTDSVAPTPMPVADYDLQDIDAIAPTDLSYEIPSKIATNSTVALPAIYATDNFYSPSELTLSRVLINTNDVETTLSGEKNETINYTFTTSGTYYVRYQASDPAGKVNTSVSFKIVVVDGFTDTVAPRVTMPTIANTAELGDTISFDSPTAIDYASTSATEKNTVDQNLEVKVYYYLGADSANKTEISYDSETSQYSFVVPTTMTDSTLTIVAEATDDFGNIGTSSSTVTIINTNDLIAPTLESTISTVPTVDQMNTVTIPTVEYADNNPSLLSVSINVYDYEGNLVSVKGLQLTYSATGVSASNANFVASYAQPYTIVYTATDVGGNSVVNSTKVLVNDTVAPIIEVSSIPTTAEIGVTITLPTPVIKDDGEIIQNYSANYIEWIGSNNPTFTFVQASMQFTPKAAGTFTFRYVGEDENGLVVYSPVYTVVATDTTKPVITLDDDIAFPVTAPLTPVSEGSSVYEAIELPSFIATDSNIIKEYSVTVTNPNGDVILNAVGTGYLNANGHYEFTPTKNGTYTVTYSATDNSGLSTETTYSVAVGDVTKPVITIQNTSVNAPSTAKVGGILKLDLSSITLTDNVDGTINSNDYLSYASSTKKFAVTLTDPDGNTVSEMTGYTYQYELSSAGTYKLVYSLTDDAGNTATKTYYIQVSAESTSATLSQSVWGTVLIVASVVLLGGVVIYFVATRNKKGKKEITKK